MKNFNGSQNFVAKQVGDQVYQYLKEEILSGGYEAGEALRANKISNELDVSNTPVREALEKLKNNNLLFKEPYIGYKVREFDYNGAKNLCETRMALETYACKLAARRIEEREKKRLINIQEKGRNYHKRGEDNKHRQYNRKLHNSIFKISDNSNLESIYREISVQTDLLVSQTVKISGQPQKSVKEHAKIIEFIVSGEENKAASKMKKHIKGVLESYKAHFQKEKN